MEDEMQIKKCMRCLRDFGAVLGQQICSGCREQQLSKTLGSETGELKVPNSVGLYIKLPSKIIVNEETIQDDITPKEAALLAVHLHGLVHGGTGLWLENLPASLHQHIRVINHGEEGYDG